MKKFQCIIRLRAVPPYIVRETDGTIDENMYLTHDAIACLLVGDMFSPLDCMYGFAAKVSEKKALKVYNQLREFNIYADIIRLW